MISGIYQIARADFLERIRRRGFLVVIFLTVLFSYIFSPPRNGKYVTLVFDQYVGLYNSAWMGTSVAISFSVFFSLIGFYFISKAVDVDRTARTGPIIAASPVGKSKYVLGKYFSNVSILCIIAAITMLSALIMQLVRGEDRTIDLWALVSPFLFMSLPLIALISAIAIWFEIIPKLQGTIGNTIYFVIWIVTVFAGAKPIPMGSYFTFTDPFGRAIPMISIAASLKEQFPDYNGQFSLGLTFLDEEAQSFLWHGVNWSWPVIFGRFAWIAASIIFAWIASLFFNRFRVKESRPSAGEQNQATVVMPVEPIAFDADLTFSSSALTPATIKAGRQPILPLLRGEFKLMMSGYRIWFLAATMLTVLGFILPLGAVERFIWPLSWVWPLAIWSAMGTRERRFRTEELHFSSPGPISMQLHATWAAGIILAVLMSSGLAVRLIAEQELTMLAVWISGAVFVPTLALACGVWSRSGKAFEIIYLSIWYMGPLNGLPVLNFMDLSEGRNVYIYSVLSLIFYVAAILGRRQRLNQ
ncbi:hypothetical protein G8C92_16450 [Paenibacillus donghaensis]|uniref:ABC transporter permease n=1 Tax=Paenibacillus donghaensis TaxID=414771 RepID=UPI001883C10E|nr:ABC-2 transporter permease [Paenibacillus donghaensis]MBE9915611.1 hypothetical protein [Paenibacillus donghaensis]